MGSMLEVSPAPHGRKGFFTARRRRRLPGPAGPEGAAGAGRVVAACGGAGPGLPAAPQQGSLRFCLPVGSRPGRRLTLGAGLCPACHSLLSVRGGFGGARGRQLLRLANRRAFGLSFCSEGLQQANRGTGSAEAMRLHSPVAIKAPFPEGKVRRFPNPPAQPWPVPLPWGGPSRCGRVPVQEPSPGAAGFCGQPAGGSAARPRGPGGTNPGLGPAHPQGDPARSETGLSPWERATGPPKTGPA